MSLTLRVPDAANFWFTALHCASHDGGERMGTAFRVTRTEPTAAALRGFAAECRDAAKVRRLLGIALALEGWSRTEAAASSGMDRQTLRDWVQRYNDEGIDGLKSRSAPGRAPALNDAQMAELKALVLKGPDPAKHKVVRWRCLDLREEVARRFSVEVHESTVGKWLHPLELTRLQPRPFHPKKDAEAQQAFKKLRRSGPHGPPRLHSLLNDRDLVSGRSQDRSERRSRLHLGGGWLSASQGARRPSRLISSFIDQNPYAQSRNPSDMMRQG